MKIGELVRFSPDKQATKYSQVLAAIDQEPGLALKDIARATMINGGTVNSVLNRALHRADVKRRKLDGVYRYYPASYKLSGEVETAYECQTCYRRFESSRALTMHQGRTHLGTITTARKKRKPAFVTLPPEAYPVATPSVEATVKDYIYDCFTHNEDATLQGFVEWSKK